MAKLEEIMSRDVISTTPDTCVSEVAAAMVKARVGSVVVLDGPWLVGILTERDVLRAAASGTALSDTPVSAWMTKDPVTAPPDMDVDEATEILAAQGFRHLPIVAGNTVAGMVSLRDLLSTRIRRPA